jgi:hypothetical protein
VCSSDLRLAAAIQATIAAAHLQPVVLAAVLVIA